MSTARVVPEAASPDWKPTVVTLSPPIPVAGESFKHSETTRLLCASAYLDATFRDLVLKFCLEKKHQALGACFGLDMPTVVRHCRKAKRRLSSREWWLLLPAFGALFTIVSMMNMTADQFSTSSATSGLMVGAVVSLLLAFFICFYFESTARRIVTHNFMRGQFKADAMLERDDTPVGELEAVESGNTLIYSGFTPFVGSGENMGAWSFALDLRKRACDPQEENVPDLSPAEIDEISIEALYDCIAREIAALHLDRVSLEDRLYVNGRDIRDDPRFLSHPLDPPHYRVDDRVMRSAMLEQNEKHLRHYRCVRVVDWNGELVFSIFLRFAKLSHNLFVEASYYLLTPVGERFRAVDRMSPHFRLDRFVSLLILTAFKTPFLTAFAPFVLLQRMFKALEHWSEERAERKLILDNPSFDYGAAFSFRQWASPNEYRRYFQKLDKEMYMKVLEKNILDTILAFLEEHDVDVSEMKQRQSMILNNGVMLSGSSFTAENVSVGKGATVQKVGQKIAQFGGGSAAPPKPA
jgi:hypothetical protein